MPSRAAAPIPASPQSKPVVTGVLGSAIEAGLSWLGASTAGRACEAGAASASAAATALCRRIGLDVAVAVAGPAVVVGIVIPAVVLRDAVVVVMMMARVSATAVRPVSATSSGLSREHSDVHQGENE